MVALPGRWVFFAANPAHEIIAANSVTRHAALVFTSNYWRLNQHVVLLPLTEQRIALLLHELDAIGPDDAPRGGFAAGVDLEIDRMRGWRHPLMVLPDHPMATKS